MAETMCPHCGYSPIAEESEQCPRCGKLFAARPREEGTMVTRTRAGALTGSVTATPTPVAVVLGLGALFWLLRAGNFLAPLGEPPALFVMAAIDVLAAVSVMGNFGPAKHAAIFAGVAGLLATAVEWHVPSVVSLLSAAHSVILMAMAVAEPGRLRLLTGAIAGSAVVVATLVVLSSPLAPRSGAPVVVADHVAGYSLSLPPGWQRAEDAAPHLVLPSDGGKTVSVAFHHPVTQQVGVLMISRDEQPDLETACRTALADFGVTGRLEPAWGRPPASLGNPARVEELRTPSGAAGRFGCGLVGQKLVVLAVVSVDPSPGVGAAAFAQVADGLLVQP